MEMSSSGSGKYDDEFDCQASIKAAYGKKGLYLLVKVIDNSYPGTITWAWWENDVVDFFIESIPTSQLYSDPQRYFYLFPEYQFTKTMTQYQCAFNKTSKVDSIHINVANPTFDMEDFKKTLNAFTANSYKTLSREKASDSLGVLVNSIQENCLTRYQEWLIPWKMIFKDGSIVPKSGSRISFCILYSDMDSTTEPVVGNAKRITWGGRDNPYALQGIPDFSKHHSWGDLEFGDSLQLNANSEASIKGARSSADIMAVVLRNISSLRAIYDQAVKKDSRLKGIIKFKLVINQSGSIVSVVVLATSTGKPDFDKQITTAIKSWQFGKTDKPGDVTEVVYPFTFQQ